jgi:hypothetical protein
MNEENVNPEDPRLSALLRQSRSKPSLPPRFQEGVWRRIEDSETSPAATPGRLDFLAAWILRPRFAVATAVVLILGGTLIGVDQGRQAAHQDAQSRYVATVAPNSLR